MRKIKNQKNLWAARGGVDPQRNDLWVLDLSGAVKRINEVAFQTTFIAPIDDRNFTHFYAQSVSLPSIDVKAKSVMRGSTPHNTPDYDEPLGAARVTFRMDSRQEWQGSEIYRLLDGWKALVRAGREPRGAEYVVPLSPNFRMEYAFNVSVLLLRGSSRPRIEMEVDAQRDIGTGVSVKPAFKPNLRDNELFPGSTSEIEAQLLKGNLARFSNLSRSELPKPVMVVNDLEVSAVYAMERAWLGGFKVSDLSYEGQAGIVTIEATIYMSNLLDMATKREVQGKDDEVARALNRNIQFQQFRKVTGGYANANTMTA